MIATLSRSRSRRIRSPRFWNFAINSDRVSDESRLRRSRIVSPPAARQQFSLRIEDLRLSGGELAAHAHDLAAQGEIARHGRAVIVDAQIDGRHPAAGLLHHGPVGGEIDERGEHAAVSVAALRIDHPFLAPRGDELDAVVVHRLHLDAEPLVIRLAGDHLLHPFDGDVFGHLITFICSSWPGLSRPSTPYFSLAFKTWMPGTRPGMTAFTVCPTRPRRSRRRRYRRAPRPRISSPA